MKSAEEILDETEKDCNATIFHTTRLVCLEAMRRYLQQFKDETEVKNLANVPVSGSFSAEYLEWVKQAELPPLTNTQHYFAEWLLKNKDIISQIGDLEIIFTKVRKWLKNLH